MHVVDPIVYLYLHRKLPRIDQNIKNISSEFEYKLKTKSGEYFKINLFDIMNCFV